MMNSLSELRDLCIKEHIPIKEFGGWFLKVNKDIWTMLDGELYKNGEKQNLKQKNLFDKYKKVIHELSRDADIGIEIRHITPRLNLLAEQQFLPRRSDYTRF